MHELDAPVMEAESHPRPSVPARGSVAAVARAHDTDLVGMARERKIGSGDTTPFQCEGPTPLQFRTAWPFPVTSATRCAVEDRSRCGSPFDSRQSGGQPRLPLLHVTKRLRRRGDSEICPET